MEAIKSRVESPIPVSDSYTNQGTVKVRSKTVVVTTADRLELVNLSDDIREFADASGIEDGYVQISSLHTTAALMVNEWQDALLTDVKAFLQRIVPREEYYKHNDPEHSDCDRKNGDAHLRNVILNHSLSIPIAQGKLVLGRWQSLILAEFDGPNQRKVFLQAFGI
ncbi:MAG: hypothetical protein DMF61_22845 [Blastocatellia bacterium AA13]|nr:MAG: hypothetical protein DMF61_22845 [Blastocatellia bacterium AA13]